MGPAASSCHECEQARSLALSRAKRADERDRGRREREGGRKGKRRARKTEIEDKPRPKRILEVKIERVSGELLLLSDSSTVVCVTGVFVPARLK